MIAATQNRPGNSKRGSPVGGNKFGGGGFNSGGQRGAPRVHPSVSRLPGTHDFADPAVQSSPVRGLAKSLSREITRELKRDMVPYGSKAIKRELSKKIHKEAKQLLSEEGDARALGKRQISRQDMLLSSGPTKSGEASVEKCMSAEAVCII